MPSNHLILPSIFPSIKVISMSQLLASDGQSTGISASASVVPINIQDWLDLLAVQGTPKSLLQHHTSKASILWRSAVFILQLSYPYMTTGKSIALTRWTFVASNVSAFLHAVYVGHNFSSKE